MKPVVIVPTYNERDNIDILLDDLLSLPVSLSVINVDDNSPDGTGEAADAWAARYPDRVQVVHRAGKLGLGTAYIAGFKRAFEAGFDRIMTMDADFSHHPRYLPSMLDLSRERDLVIGSRYVPGGGTLNCTAKRKAVEPGREYVCQSDAGPARQGLHGRLPLLSARSAASDRSGQHPLERLLVPDRNDLLCAAARFFDRRSADHL